VNAVKATNTRGEPMQPIQAAESFDDPSELILEPKGLDHASLDMEGFEGSHKGHVPLRVRLRPLNRSLPSFELRIILLDGGPQIS